MVRKFKRHLDQGFFYAGKLVGILFLFLGRYLSLLLGHVQYERPAWIAHIGKWFSQSKVKYQLDRLWVYAKQNPRRVRLFAASMVCIGASGWYAFQAWQIYRDSLPQTVYVGIEMETTPGIADPQDQMPKPLEVRFTQSVAKLEDLNRVLQLPVTMSPELQGQWRWKSDRVLIFQPEKSANGKNNWHASQKYEIQFPKELFATHAMFENYDFSFETEPVQIHFTKGEFYIDPTNPNDRRALFHVTSNYPLEPENIKRHIKMTIKRDLPLLPEIELPYSVTFDDFQRVMYLKSDGLMLQDEEQIVLVEVSKGAEVIQGLGELLESISNTVRVPSLTEGLKVESFNLNFATNKKMEPEQILIVSTSIGVQSEVLAKALSVWLLDPKKDKTPWQSVSELNFEKELRNNNQLKLELIPSSEIFATTHTFKIIGEPFRQIYLKVRKGMLGLGGFKLKDDRTSIETLKDYPLELQFVGEGSIMTLSGEKKIPLFGRNLKSVTYSIDRVLPEQMAHLMSSLQQSYVDLPKLDLDLNTKWAITEHFEETQELTLISRSQTQYFSINLEKYIQGGKGTFIVSVEGKSKGNLELRQAQRVVMITDFGLASKRNLQGQRELFVYDFAKESPAAGVTVEVIGRNGLNVFNGTADLQGHIVIPDLRDFKREREPLAILARSAADSAYLPFNHSSRNLSFNQFDVGGERESSNSDELTAMLFSDRGLYRPGEKIHLGFIVRKKSKGELASYEIPMEMVIENSKQQVIETKELKVLLYGLQDYNFSTLESASTGMYRASLYLLNKKDSTRKFVGSTEIKVQEFQPDRLRINTEFTKIKEMGWLRPEELSSTVKLMNLFGTPAEKRRIKAKIRFNPVHPYFKIYDSYQFTNVNPLGLENYSETLSDAETDAEGKTSYTLDLKQFRGKLYQIYFEAEGFEAEGGRGVSAVSSQLISSMDFLIGFKSDATERFLKRDVAHSIELIAIDSDLKKISVDHLELEWNEKNI